MKIKNFSSPRYLHRRLAVWLIALLTVPLAQASTMPLELASQAEQQQTSPAPQTIPASRDQSPASNPTSGASSTQTGSVDSTSSSGSTPQSGAAAAQRPTLQSGAETQQAAPPQPVGTAAAPYEKPSGVTASRPAGAAIAPGKQRRAMSIVIKVSLVVGAAVAVGTVVALSKASPSRPN
jgi:cytoskeletal protein RodZ